MNEELEMVNKSFEELQNKKQSEIELLTKEINMIAVKEKDQKQRLHLYERELTET